MKLHPAMLSALLALGGCGTAELFDVHEVPEAPGTAEAPWPRLVDVPTPPPPGVHTDAVPDPLAGLAIQTELGIAARAAAERAQAMPGPAVEEEALRARARRAQARAEQLQAPVLTEAERERLRAAVR